MKRTPLRRVSLKRQSQLVVYARRRAVWLACKTCALCGRPATEIHHTNGRTGARLLDEFWWVAVCRSCHGWMHANPANAKQVGMFTDRKDEK